METLITAGVGVDGYAETPTETVAVASSTRRSLQTSTAVEEEACELLSYSIPSDTEATTLQLSVISDRQLVL